MGTTAADATSRDLAAGRKPESGFSLIEIMVGTSILLIGLLTLGSSMMYAYRLDRATEERKAALSFATSQIERIRGLKFVEVAARPRINNATPTLDPPGAGGYLCETTWGTANVGATENTGTVGFRQDLDADGDEDYFGLNFYRQATTVGNLRIPVTKTMANGYILTVSDPRLDGLTPQTAPDASVTGRVAQVLVRDSDATTGLVEGSGYWITVRVFWVGSRGGNEELRMSTFVAR